MGLWSYRKSNRTISSTATTTVSILFSRSILLIVCSIVLSISSIPPDSYFLRFRPSLQQGNYYYYSEKGHAETHRCVGQQFSSSHGFFQSRLQVAAAGRAWQSGRLLCGNSGLRDRYWGSRVFGGSTVTTVNCILRDGDAAIQTTWHFKFFSLNVLEKTENYRKLKVFRPAKKSWQGSLFGASSNPWIEPKTAQPMSIFGL